VKIGVADITKKFFLYAWIRNEYKQIDLGREILEKVLHFAFYGIKTCRGFRRLSGSVMQNDKGTSTQELRDALKWYGLKTATNARLKYTGDVKLPDCCILSVMLPGYGHWSLYYKGKYYDPEFGVLDKLPEQAKLRYYWEVVI